MSDRCAEKWCQGPERTTAETAAALSRYQASRAAAQAAAEKGNR